MHPGLIPRPSPTREEGLVFWATFLITYVYSEIWELQSDGRRTRSAVSDLWTKLEVEQTHSLFLALPGDLSFCKLV